MILDLGALATIAIVFMVLMAAYVFIKYFLYPLMDQIPVVGHYIQTHMSRMVEHVRHTLTHWVEASVRPLYDVFVLPIEKLGAWMDEAAVIMAALAWWVMHLDSNKLNKTDIIGMNNDVINLKSEVQYLKSQNAQLHRQIDGINNAINHTIPRATDTAIQSAVSGLNQTMINHQRQSARQIQQAINTARQAVQNTDNIEAKLKHVTQSLNTTLNQTVAGLQTDIKGRIGSLQNDITDYLDKNLGKLSTDLVDVGARAAVGIEIGTVAKAEIDTFLDNCGRNLCESFGQQAENIQRMMQFAEDGTLLALLEYVVSNPDGAATDFSKAFEGTFSEISAFFENLGK
jgi:hypothetical protein